MSKVQIIMRSLMAGPNGIYQEGQKVELDKKQAEELVLGGYAQYVDEKAQAKATEAIIEAQLKAQAEAEAAAQAQAQAGALEKTQAQAEAGEKTQAQAEGGEKSQPQPPADAKP
jgi:phage gp45-like